MFVDHPPMSTGDMSDSDPFELESGLFPGGCVVQLVAGLPDGSDAEVTTLESATIRVTDAGVLAVVAGTEWSWLLGDLEDVFHGGDDPWTILVVPGVADHGVAVRPDDASRFRRQLEGFLPPSTRVHRRSPDPSRSASVEVQQRRPFDDLVGGPTVTDPGPPVHEVDTTVGAGFRSCAGGPMGVRDERVPPERDVIEPSARPSVSSPPAGLEARGISAWFGTHLVLESVSLEMAAGEVTALIGPSGCGKSTFLRILNRMHELVPSASLAGEVLLDGADIYDSGRKVTEARRQIGMVFQKPNPFPAMSIYDNVLASFQLTGRKVSAAAKDEVVESCLRKAGLWNEVRERLRQPGGSLSGGQQQRLCIARALAIRPKVLLMDEPCSALDPTSTRRIEQTISELASEVTIVIVTHNMQQAARVSARCAFFLAEQGTPGVIVEHGPTEAMFQSPRDQRTSDYVNGRFG